MPPAVPRIKFICQQCGAPFARMASQLKHDPVRFCSRACLYASLRTGQERNCEECGKAFYRRASDAGACCSRECADARSRRGAHSYPKIGGRHAHRVIAEQGLGRPLRHGEIVHHKDENKLNCVPGNLDVLPSQAEHARLHFTGKKQSAEHVRKRVDARARTLREQGRKR